MSQQRVKEVQDLIESYYEQGLTDGLPVVPPTREKVSAMLATVNLDAETEIARIPPSNRVGTAGDLAANAVMAGCLPSYFPVVLAGVRAMVRPEFNLHGVQATTHVATPLFLVNGPIRSRLEINGGPGVFGPGWRANTTIGRALRLIMLNIGGATPGLIDKSTLGNPGKFSYCIAENEENSPWEPFHVEHGFRPEESTISVFAAEAPHSINDHRSNRAHDLATTLAESMMSGGSSKAFLAGQTLLIVCPEHARTFSQEGWSKKDLRRFIYEKARRPLGEILVDEEVGEGMPRKSFPPWIPTQDPSTRVPKFHSPDSVVIVVAGGTAGRFSAHLPGWGGRKLGSQIVTEKIPSEEDSR